MPAKAAPRKAPARKRQAPAPAGRTTASSGQPAPPAPAPPPAPQRPAQGSASPAGAAGGGGPVSAPRWADTGAEVILGVLVWGLVVLPFLRGGPAEVKKMLLAKFFNMKPDGGYL